MDCAIGVGKFIFGFFGVDSFKPTGLGDFVLCLCNRNYLPCCLLMCLQALENIFCVSPSHACSLFAPCSSQRFAERCSAHPGRPAWLGTVGQPQALSLAHRVAQARNRGNHCCCCFQTRNTLLAAGNYR